MTGSSRRDHHRAPVPEGWPGDDPTVPEDLALLGGRRRGRHDRRPPRPAGDAAPRSAAPPVHEPGTRDELAAADGLAPVDGGVTPPADGPRTVPDAADASRDDVTGAARTEPDLDDDLVAGHQPAGRVLVVIVAALVLAMLVNADALVARAERRPPGPDRDRALAVWHPVQDVSHVLQLHRVRQALDRAVGDDDAGEVVPSPRDERRAPGATAGRATTTTVAATSGEGTTGAPELRSPTADDPLRLWVGGDSMAQAFGPALAARAEATRRVTATVHVEGASGLVRPDYFDWPEALVADVADGDSEVVVFVAGVNDGQGVVLPDGTPVPDVADPRWAEEYRRRVGDLMDRMRADDRLLLWVLLPPMADAGYGGRQAVIRDAVVAEAAAGRPWVVTVDATASLGDPSGAYTATLPDASGTPVEIRRPDGIHLTEAGGERLAAQVLDVVGARVDLAG